MRKSLAYVQIVYIDRLFFIKDETNSLFEENSLDYSSRAFKTVNRIKPRSSSTENSLLAGYCNGIRTHARARSVFTWGKLAGPNN